MKGWRLVSKLTRYPRVGKARKCVDPKKLGEGGVGFLIKEHLLDVVEVVVSSPRKADGLRYEGSEVRSSCVRGMYAYQRRKQRAGEPWTKWGRCSEVQNEGRSCRGGGFQLQSRASFQWGQATGQYEEDKGK